MREFLQEYGSLLMGFVIALCMFMVGMVSIWRDEARRKKIAGTKQSGQHGHDLPSIRN